MNYGILKRDLLKKRLRHQGNQYSNGMASRGGSREVHMLTQAADRIEELEVTLNLLLNDLINFGGEDLTDSIMAEAHRVISDT